MDLIKLVFSTLKKNMAMAIVLVSLAITGGILHYYIQSISYVSNFKTNSGFVDYPLFKSLTDFNQVTEDVYDLPAEEINRVNTILENYRISFIEETSISISFTVVTKTENADHKLVQESVLNLINHNRFTKNSYQEDLLNMKKKLGFLDGKMSQMDSLIANPTAYTNVSEVLRHSYDLYIEQLDLEEKIKSTGKFDIIKPVTEIKTNKKPMILYIALYIILVGFIFLVFSKKETAEAA